MERIPVSGPSISQKEIAYVADAVAHGWYEHANHYHDRFEQAFAKYLGVRFTVALPLCTSAIHLALAALGVGPGDEVIVPDITWIATAAPVTYVGATPVFADIDPLIWCLDPESCQSYVTPRTRAIIPVDLYGNMADMDRLNCMGKEQNFYIIEDAAQAIGAEWQGKKAGSLGDIGVFSFHGSKTLTTGEGGMLVTDSEKIHQRVLFLRDHGRERGDKMFWNSEVAYKYKMSCMQAAMGLAQLERVDALVQRKREIFSWYQRELMGMEGLSLNRGALGTRSSYWMVTAQWGPERSITKEQVIAAMGERGIDCRPFFYPLSSLPAYAKTKQTQKARKRNEVAYRISPYAVNLPSGFNMTPEKVKRACDAFKEALKT